MDLHQFAIAVSRRTQYQFGDEAGCYAPPRINEIALNESLRLKDFDNWDYTNEIHKRSLVVSHTGLPPRSER